MTMGAPYDDKNKDFDTASYREKVKLTAGEKWRILKNITVVSFAFMIQFTAFQVKAEDDFYFQVLKVQPIHKISSTYIMVV